MNELYYWYILYVRANSEPRVMRELNLFVRSRGYAYGFDIFCPQSEFYYRNKKERVAGRQYRKRPLFPGYVFVETAMPQDEFIREFGNLAYSSDDIIRILRSGENNIALPFDERRRLEYFLRGKRCFDRSVGVIAGDAVCVSDGPLKGMEGAIVRVNRHNRSADIELEMFGGKIKAQVALEIIEKTA